MGHFLRKSAKILTPLVPKDSKKMRKKKRKTKEENKEEGKSRGSMFAADKKGEESADPEKIR
jgi:hypothetical protein